MPQSIKIATNRNVKTDSNFIPFGDFECVKGVVRNGISLHVSPEIGYALQPSGFFASIPLYRISHVESGLKIVGDYRQARKALRHFKHLLSFDWNRPIAEMRGDKQLIKAVALLHDGVDVS